jgi:hypothetical protein
VSKIEQFSFRRDGILRYSAAKSVQPDKTCRCLFEVAASGERFNLFADELLFFAHRCTSSINRLAMQSRILMNHLRRDMRREEGKSDV